MNNRVGIIRSLRDRLAITLIGGAAVLAILLYLVVRSYAAQIAQQGQDSILAASVTSILDAAILRDGEVEVDFPYASFSMLSTDSDDRVFYAIYQDDELISGYDTLFHSDPIPDADHRFGTATLQNAEVRVASAARTLIGAQVTTVISVSVAQTQDALEVTLNRISRNAAGFGAGFFLLATALSFWATSTTIGPLKRLTSSVTRRGPQDLRPFEQPVPTEMEPLVASLNNLMGRLDQSLSQSEDFIAEAAHRVRTPLATVRSYAEATLQRVGKPENRHALRSMVKAIDESSRAAGQLLDHAMITFRADHLDKQDLDLGELVGELVRSLTPIAEMKDVRLQIRCPETVNVQGDAILLQNAIRNVIDNALKYSPAESDITISVSNSAEDRIAIRDEGPGFPENNMAMLADRFTRGSNSEGITGSGLGLTIAQDVVIAHGGHLVLANHAEGGACVTLSF
ncbi:sensor histidine kinase [Cognatishimia activa]|uniref:histidine kinase n=1 Tax=Cognatishimia activa TaxID=1715691 RepID=A0A0P1ILL4_9RHOB|nr:sensor histidine kinase [Cognatishimia activa]CUI39244.1 Swarming motility regulation sensor protein RssA [Cognatishimia activa]CUK24519.1 Swarming motility regulation sensor protein RssA [Cognatishimia activa]